MWALGQLSTQINQCDTAHTFVDQNSMIMSIDAEDYSALGGGGRRMEVPGKPWL